GGAVERIARVQSLDLLEVVRVVAGERPDPREAANIDAGDMQAAGKLDGSGRLGGHRSVLSQSRRKAVKAAPHGITPQTPDGRRRIPRSVLHSYDLPEEFFR